MGNPEHERNSSSASADFGTGIVGIVSIEAGTPAGVMEVTLADGSRFFILKQLLEQHGPISDAGTASQISPQQGEGLYDQLAELQLLSRRTLARRKSMELLARREYSRRELAQRLAQRGYEREVTEPVLDELARRGYQSDQRYALAWIESRLRRRPRARGLLLLELQAKGVDSPVAAAAVREYERDNPDWEEEALDEAARRALRGKKVTLELIVAKLTQLGFGVAAAQRAARRALS